MSQQSPEESTEPDGPMTVPDAALPEDLQPSDDNPLAQHADDEVPDDVLTDTAGGSSGDSEDASKGGGDADDASSDGASSEAES